MSTARTLRRNQYVTAALKQHRAILAGELQELHRQAKVKTDALAHIDAVLALCAPEVDVEAITPKRVQMEPYTVPNISCRIRDALRRREEPMYTWELVDVLMAEMGHPAAARAAVAYRTRLALRDLEKAGALLKAGERTHAIWRLRV